uniref:GNAT family N-acetyltransferase n=1 Tax=Flavobacterium sp. TaxID=239 RepID=UPI004049BEA2
MHLHIKPLASNDISLISPFGKQLNPSKSIAEIEDALAQMFQFNNYYCFGLYQNNLLIGICGGWLTVRIYSGRQLEIDHFVIDEKIRSGGFGKTFISLLEDWAKEKNCKTVELNAYVQSDKAHKFYFQNEYKVLGFHFQKNLN